MKLLVTGSAGHLGEALVRSLRADANVKANELPYRRVDIADAVGSHRLGDVPHARPCVGERP